MHSNTTLVKVKSPIVLTGIEQLYYSNTTLVKVKLLSPEEIRQKLIEFKYNTC